MTQQEFEGRTGIAVTSEIFDEIHEDYMAKNYDKDTYCRAYVVNGCMLEDTRRMERKIYSLENNFNECLEAKNKAWNELSAPREKAAVQAEEYRRNIEDLKDQLADIEWKYGGANEGRHAQEAEGQRLQFHRQREGVPPPPGGLDRRLTL